MQFPKFTMLTVILPALCTITLCLAGRVIAQPQENDPISVGSDADTDNRLSIAVLRRRVERSPGSLSAEETAILRAANRTGVIQFPDCKREANDMKLMGSALLVNVNGQDAIMTSAQLILDPKTGDTRYSCTADQLKRVVYYPNVSYIDLNGAEEPEDGTPEMLALEFDETGQFNLMKITRERPAMNDRNDWVIFTLPRHISGEEAIDGKVRGHLELASNALTKNREHEGFLIGFDPNYDPDGQGPATSYQKCKFKLTEGQIEHFCYTTHGSISSLLGVMEGGEIKLIGMHHADLLRGEIRGSARRRPNRAVSPVNIESAYDIRFAR